MVICFVNKFISQTGVYSGNLVILSVPSDDTIALVEANNATLASVTTDEVEDRILLWVF